MQTQVANQGGKLESIKNIGALIPDIEAHLKQCNSVRAQLEAMLNGLTSHVTSIAQTRENQIIREQKQSQYADLIKQRQAEREEAERKVDERTQTRLAATKPPPPKITHTPNNTVKPSPHQPSTPPTNRGVPSTPKPLQAWSSGRTFPPREQGTYGNRPSNFGQGQRPSGYQGNRPSGNFPPRPAGALRTPCARAGGARGHAASTN